MPLTIIETPGASNANSYNSLAEFDAYLDTLITPGDAFDASDEDKKKALITTTPLIDARGCEVWIGAPAVAGQALVWPRTGATDRSGAAIGSGVIPAGIKLMHAELARLLLNGTLDPAAQNEAAAKGIKEIKAGPVSLKFGDDFAALIMLPDSVRQYLVPGWCVVTSQYARFAMV